MVIMIKIFIKKNIITLTLAILLLVLSVVSLFIGVIDINIKNYQKKSFFGFTVNGSLCDIKTSKTSGNFVYRSRNECSRTYNAAAVHE